MKAIRNPTEVEIFVLKPTIQSIKKCYLFLYPDMLEDKFEEDKEEIINMCLKEFGVRYFHDNKSTILPFNTVVIKNNDVVTAVTIDHFHQMYEIKTPLYITEKYKLINSLTSDIGFIGSPEYNELQQDVEQYNIQVKEFFNLNII